jgi:hypothetical protein
MITKYKSRDDFLAAAAGRLGHVSLPKDLHSALVDGIAQADRELQSTGYRDDPSASHLRLGKWFIRNDDLPLLDALGVVGSSIATLLSGGTVEPATAVTGLTSLAKSCWQVWRKGGGLLEGQVRILAILQTKGPLNLDAITNELNASSEGAVSVDPESTLRSLERIELYDGTIVPLVRQDPDAKWQALDII